MKVLVNGGLNVSELDGWWAEAYTPDVGWGHPNIRSRASGKCARKNAWLSRSWWNARHTEVSDANRTAATAGGRRAWKRMMM
jgi:glucan phosphorylase